MTATQAARILSISGEKQVPSAPAPPTVWVLLGTRAGEIAQLRIVATAVGGRIVEKRLGSDALEPPWPDLTMSFVSDVRSALRVRAASGGGAKLVQFARQRVVPPLQLDLLIAMPQDRLPDAPNLLRPRMSYNRQNAAQLAAGARAVAPRLAQLPRPWTALILGGSSRHFGFDTATAAELGRRATQHAQARGGSLLVSTSPRSDAPSVQALRATVATPCEFYEFRVGDEANPLAGYLALADDVIVTGDSASMPAEAWRTGKPVYVFPLPAKDNAANHLKRALRRWLPVGVQDALLARGLISAPVDLRGWLDERLAAGDFARLGDPPPRRRYDAAADDDLERTVARIRALLPDACWL